MQTLNFITANVKIRALRRYKELRQLRKKVSYDEVLKSIKKRDKNDINRKISPLKKTKDSLLINTTNLTKRACFLKIKKIIDKKINLMEIYKDLSNPHLKSSKNY